MSSKKLVEFGTSSIALAIFAAIGLNTLPLQAALLLSNSGDDSVKQYDETTGEYIRDFISSGSGGLLDPRGLTIGPDGNLYVSSSGTNSVKKYDATTGDYLGDFVTNDDGGTLNQPNGLAFGPDGNLYVGNTLPGTDPGNPFDDGITGGVLKYSGTTGDFINNVAVGLEDGNGDTSYYRDVAFDLAGNLYTTSSGFRAGAGQLEVYDPAGQNILNFSAGFRPFGLAVSSSGDVFSSESVGFIYKLTDTEFGQEFVTFGEVTNIDSQYGDLIIAENGNLLRVDVFEGDIEEFDGDTGEFLGNLVSLDSSDFFENGEFRNSAYLLSTDRVPVPEPSSILGVLALSGLFVGGSMQRKLKKLQK